MSPESRQCGFSDIVGLIPAAGRGVRLEPYPCPKELFPVGVMDYEVDGRIEQRPKVVSQYLFDELKLAGARRFLFILGDGKQAIMRYFGNGKRAGVDVAYLYQEALRGMPFALDLAFPWLRRDSVVLFGMPDTILEPQEVFVRVLDEHRKTGADVSLGLFRTETPWKFGMVRLDADNRLVENRDKPRETDLEYMWGFGCWGWRFAEVMHEFLATIPPGGKETVLSEVFEHAQRSGLDIRGVRLDDGRYTDIGA